MQALADYNSFRMQFWRSLRYISLQMYYMIPYIPKHTMVLPRQHLVVIKFATVGRAGLQWQTL